MHWEQKLDDAQKRYGEVTAPLEMVVMRLEQPVWARGVLGFDAVLPAKAASAPRIHFVCGSGEAHEDAGGKVVSQPTNDLGRLSRALAHVPRGGDVPAHQRADRVPVAVDEAGRVHPVGAIRGPRPSCRPITRRRTSSCSCTSTRA